MWWFIPTDRSFFSVLILSPKKASQIFAGLFTFF
jgi:hypothetical protein